MKYRELARTGIKISEISLGCWTMGGLNWNDGIPNGWANVDEKEIKDAIDFAIASGVNHFDNADVYGNGRAERLLRRALGKKSNDVIIASKVGWFKGTAEFAYEPLHIRHQCEQSLKNLGREYIDIYYFHNANFGKSDFLLDDAVGEMKKLKSEGKIRIIGQSAYSTEDFLRVIPKVQPDVIQSWANALDDQFIAENTRVEKICKENNISFIAFGPLAQGLLLGKYDKNNLPKFEAGDHRLGSNKFSYNNLKYIEEKLEILKNKFGKNIKDLTRIALRYPLCSDIVCSVIPGFRNLEQVRLNLSVADTELSDEEMCFVKETFST